MITDGHIMVLLRTIYASGDDDRLEKNFVSRRVVHEGETRLPWETA
jgi:hypothetical protein